MKKKKIGDIVAIAKGRKAQKVFEEKLPNAVRYIQIEDLRTDNKIQYTADTNGIFVSGSDLCIAWDGANAGTVGYGLSGMIGSTIARLCINDSEIRGFKFKVQHPVLGYWRLLKKLHRVS